MTAPCPGSRPEDVSAPQAATPLARPPLGLVGLTNTAAGRAVPGAAGGSPAEPTARWWASTSEVFGGFSPPLDADAGWDGSDGGAQSRSSAVGLSPASRSARGCAWQGAGSTAHPLPTRGCLCLENTLAGKSSGDAARPSRAGSGGGGGGGSTVTTKQEAPHRLRSLSGAEILGLEGGQQ